MIICETLQWLPASILLHHQLASKLEEEESLLATCGHVI